MCVMGETRPRFVLNEGAYARRWVLTFCLALILTAQALAGLSPVRGPERFSSDEDFLEYVQRQHFRYFQEEVNPANGLVRDRSTSDSPCSIAAVGFSLSAYNVAVERGWVSRDEAIERTLRTLETFLKLPQGPERSGIAGYKGWFYHFLDMKTGHRVWNCELSTIDTALLMMGVIDASLFFDSAQDARERRIRRLSQQLLDRIDWGFMLRTNDFQLSMEWTPERGHSRAGWAGYNEAMCMYLLGLGMPRSPLPPQSWKGWTSTYSWTNYGGYRFATCPPLFTHQYSHMWLDFRGMPDQVMRERGSDYFKNSRNATLAQRLYAVNNPLKFPNYSANEWGLTACDGPGATIGGIRYQAYSARGAPGGLDDGTIAPTAAVASLPFAPEECLAALKHFYNKYGDRLWTDKGFRDAYNIKADWWGPDAIGIDQGPIVLMIENARTGSVWKRMMKSPILQRGLERAGFSPPPPSGTFAPPLSLEERTPAEHAK
jgi:hypothetical protein